MVLYIAEHKAGLDGTGICSCEDEICRRNYAARAKYGQTATRLHVEIIPPLSDILLQIQVYGFNAELYHNMSEAQHKSQGLVAISLMVQVSRRNCFPTPKYFWAGPLLSL